MATMGLHMSRSPVWQRLLTLLLLFCFHHTCSVLAYTPISDATLQSLPRPGADFDIHTGAILAPILIPRVPGTEGSAKVQQHFVDWFTTHLPRWTISFQNSTDYTPATGDKKIPFVNIIISRDPPWTKPGDVGRLTLVAHYDSKLTPEGFIGATDSAAPCAMIMHAARSVDEALTRKWDAMAAAGENTGLIEETGVQILFLDGEEAFVNWTNDDSLYGSRSLAETWESQANPALSTFRTPLSSITLFVLLDLLGASAPNIPTFFRNTHWAYQHMASCESRLRKQSLLKSKPKRAFLPDGQKPVESIMSGMVEDDHVPFLARGVEVLHIIPLPFPRVWHTMEDDGEHLDIDSTEDWAVIVTAFVAEWMDLEDHFPPNQSTSASIQATTPNPVAKREDGHENEIENADSLPGKTEL